MLIVDASHMLHRASYAPTKANLELSDTSWKSFSYFFFLILFRAIKDFKTKKVICCWDKNGSSRRRSVWPDHKKKEPIDESTDEGQLTKLRLENYVKARLWIHENLHRLGFISIMIDGIEADDIAFSLVNKTKISESGFLISGDWDWQQSLLPGWQLCRPLKDQKWEKVTWENFCETYGNEDLEKNSQDYIKKAKLLYIYCKAMAGKRNEIPGVKGLGEKTAIPIAKKLMNGEKLNTKKIREKNVLAALKDKTLFRDIDLASYLEVLDFEINQIKTNYEESKKHWDCTPTLYTFLDFSSELESKNFAMFMDNLNF